MSISNATILYFKNEIKDKDCEFADLLDKFILDNEKSVIFDAYYNFFDQYHESLIEIDLNGIYVLLCKADYCGYYSVGNALDIIDTIDLVRPYITNNDDIANLNIYEPLFKHSIEIHKIISLS